MTDEEKTVRTNAQAFVDSFDEKFQEPYGEGHLLMACHSAFPMAVTPDMLYQLWANFREYNDSETGLMHSIDRIAVSDVLLWRCWQEVDTEVYELDVAVRACLLDTLRNDARFGEDRLRELAQFLHQYTERIIKDQLGTPFREIQKWTAMATLAPAEAAKELSERLTASVESTNEPELFRLRNILEALTGQQERFRGMLYFSKALKAYYLGYDARTINQQIDLAKEQRGYGLTTDILPGEPFLTVPVPADLPNKSRLPAKPASKLYILSIGIDKYEDKKLNGCINDARLLVETLSEYNPNPVAYKGLLLDEQATKENILLEFGRILQKAEENDVVAFTFSGHGQSVQNQSTILTYGANSQIFSTPIRNTPESIEQLAMHTITENEFREHVQKVGQKDPHIVLIMDSRSGSPNWLDSTNAKHVILMAASSRETPRETIIQGEHHGVFTAALVNELRRSQNKELQTYSNIMRSLYRSMKKVKRNSQTPQLFSTKKALQRPFLSIDDSGILYMDELIRYGIEETGLVPNHSEGFLKFDKQTLLDQLLDRFIGLIPKISEANANEINGCLEQAITTADAGEGLSAICIGSGGGLVNLIG